MKRRIFRVHLPFVLVVLLTVLIPWNKFSLGAFLSNVFFYKMFFEDWNCAYGGQMWFVSMIAQMYLLFPILAKVLDRQASNRGASRYALMFTAYKFNMGDDCSSIRQDTIKNME